MDVRRLRYFTGVAEAGSLSAAAIRIGVSQPSLSRQISLLEDELGVKLFERQRRGVALTRAGEALFLRIRMPLDEIDKALRDTRTTTRSNRRANIVLWMPPTVEDMLAGPMTRRLAADAPEIALRIAEGPAGSLAAVIRRRELDVAIVYGPREFWDQMDWRRLMPDAETLDLLEEDMVLVGPPSSDLRHDRPVPVETLATLPLVFPSRSNLPAAFRLLLQEMAETIHGQMREFQESDSLEQTKEMAASGMGYAILPLSVVLREVRQGALAYAPIRSPHARRRLILIWRRDCPAPAAQARTIALLRDTLGHLVASGAWPAMLLFPTAEL